MTTLNLELSRVARLEWLNGMNAGDLAHWLVHSFTPSRYRDAQDVIEPACRLLYQKSNNPELVQEFINRLWGMFGQIPDYQANVEMGKVVSFRRNVDAML